MDLDLPKHPVAQRVVFTGGKVGYLAPGERKTYFTLDGPGCIRQIFIADMKEDAWNRDIIIRIYFDGAEIPHVEAPLGDFFGLMHGYLYYSINCKYLSVQHQNGYNCYFQMPFAESARVEFEAGEHGHHLGMQCNWHRYPGQTMPEKRRFCARWRREMPASRYTDGYLVLDADGPGEILGFVYGVRVIDNVDRWSHGGAENIYIDGEGEHPTYIRGMGGEDTFGVGYGGAVHVPESHLVQGMPCYKYEDTGEPRPSQHVVGYRFYDPDTIPYRDGVHFRFGSMCNDICSTVYWYQEGAVRPFFRMPGFDRLKPWRLGQPVDEPVIPRGTCDLPVPETGTWWLCGPFYNAGERAMNTTLPPEETFDADSVYEANHEEDSPWVRDKLRCIEERTKARWVKRAAVRGFCDFNDVFRPGVKGVCFSDDGTAVARCVLRSEKDTTAAIRVAFDDHCILRVNGRVFDLGTHALFREATIETPLKRGDNTITLKLSNTLGLTNGGWAFAFRATASDDTLLRPCDCSAQAGDAGEPGGRIEA